MKRFFSIILIIFSIMAFCSCSKNQKPTFSATYYGLSKSDSQNNKIQSNGITRINDTKIIFKYSIFKFDTSNKNVAGVTGMSQWKVSNDPNGGYWYNIKIGWAGKDDSNKNVDVLVQKDKKTIIAVNGFTFDQIDKDHQNQISAYYYPE